MEQMESGQAGEPEPTACAVCAQPLFAASSGGEIVAWLHREELLDVSPEIGDLSPAQVRRVKERLEVSPVDHLAVPVGIEEVQAETRCDFCSGPNPGWVLPVDSFEASASQASAKDYAACDVCARLIRKSRWDDVVARAVNRAAQRYNVNPSDKRLLDAMKAHMSQVRAYQTGPIRRT